MAGNLTPDQIAIIMERRRQQELAELQAMQAADRNRAATAVRPDIQRMFDPAAQSLAFPNGQAPAVAPAQTAIVPVQPTTVEQEIQQYRQNRPRYFRAPGQ